MTCPFCDADQPELISLFGSQLLLSQYRCRACGTYFEGIREDGSEAASLETNPRVGRASTGPQEAARVSDGRLDD
jgi:transposase-like protein